MTRAGRGQRDPVPVSTAVEPAGARDVRVHGLLGPLMLGIGAGFGLFLAWQAMGALLLIFAGLLFAAVLDACTVGLGYVLPIGRRWRLAIVTLAMAAALALGLSYGGYALLQQIADLANVIAAQFDALRRMLRAMGVTPQHLGASPDQTYFDLMLPDTSTLFGHARTLFGATLGLVGNAVVIGFLGLFVAASPHAYRDGAVMLAPARFRRRVSDMLDDMAVSLRWWLIAQLATMALIAVSTWLALAFIGMPNAFVLGMLAGLLNFIPYLGPVLGGVPIVLAAMPLGVEMVLWALGVYVALQSVEGYLIAPMIQRRAVDIAPALSLGGLVVFGSLFGGMGVALAVPLLAVIRIAILHVPALQVSALQVSAPGDPERNRRNGRRGTAPNDGGPDPSRSGPA